MHKVWHYLLHAEFHQAKIDYRYRDYKTGQCVTIDGEPKAWDLERCLSKRYPNSADPVRLEGSEKASEADPRPGREVRGSHRPGHPGRSEIRLPRTARPHGRLQDRSRPGHRLRPD
ncbi:DUF3644 domain-containing protein [Streptomyces chartreusis]